MRVERPVRQLGNWATTALMVMVVLLWGATFRAGVEKNLVGTLNAQEWGRYLFAFGATLTQSRFGIGGYVIDGPIEQKLQSEGLTDNPEVLKRLGSKFPDNLHDSRIMQNALERANDFDVAAPPPGDYQRLRGSVGDDVGIATFTSFAFRLFGLKVSSLYYTYFSLLGVAIFFFLLGHYRSPGALTCLALMMLAIYLLVISNLMNQTIVTISIKDPRFFGTIAAIAALHLLLVWNREDYPLRIVDYVAVAGQALMFAFALHIRWPSSWLVLSLCGSWIMLCLWQIRGILRKRGKLNRCQRIRYFLFGAIFFLIIGAGVIATNMTAHPLYRIDGDVLRHPFWHHMIGSLEANPEWWTKYFPTVNGVSGDSMPAEIAKQEIAKLPPDQRPQYLMRIGYPSPQAIAFFARKRFFQILRADPWFVIRTFAIENPKVMIAQIPGFYGGFAQVVTPAQLAGPILSLVLLLWVVATKREALLVLTSITPIAVILAVIALAPLIIATAHPLIMVDHFLWSLFSLGLIACVGTAYVINFFSFARQSLP